MSDYEYSWMERNWLKLFWLCAALFMIVYFGYGFISPDSHWNKQKQEYAQYESIKNDCKTLASFIRDNYGSDYEKEYEHYYSWSCQK